MNKTFKEIQKLLYRNQKLLEERMPVNVLQSLFRDYGHKYHVPDYVMRRDLRVIKGYLNA